ncbi:hypothetical protein E8E12_003461 [Didymella heteroderae]|uniref:Cytochrome P450 n=1 Tax=Didymella heteroderae TaxID=1769908 RepID=A0A9P4WK03_9PLEO|nr:hypothetical protein E8E12_003461 [Didymella heteroderae]
MQLGFLAELLNTVEDGLKVELFDFVARVISVASNRTFYGPRNPYEKLPDLLDRFWEWENGMVSILVGIIPKITARRAHKGLQACAEKFAEYERTGGHADAHHIVKARIDSHLRHGISLMERSKLDAGLGFAFNVNASITAFWVLSNIYSRPGLLARLRDEVHANALSQPATLSFGRLRDSGVQWVKEDTIIANQYLVRKGSVARAAGTVLHHDKATCGPDAESFNPDRFLHSTNGTKTDPSGSFESKSNIPSTAFRSFGGGKHMCPGRHFATAEILSLSAVMILGFEFETVDKSA